MLWSPKTNQAYASESDKTVTHLKKRPIPHEMLILSTIEPLPFTTVNQAKLRFTNKQCVSQHLCTTQLPTHSHSIWSMNIRTILNTQHAVKYFIISKIVAFILYCYFAIYKSSQDRRPLFGHQPSGQEDLFSINMQQASNLYTQLIKAAHAEDRNGTLQDLSLQDQQRKA